MSCVVPAEILDAGTRQSFPPNSCVGGRQRFPGAGKHPLAVLAELPLQDFERGRVEASRSKRQPSDVPLRRDRSAVEKELAAWPLLDRAPSGGFTTSSGRYKIARMPECRNSGNWKPMETVKLGKKGQMSIPKGILKRLGLEGDVTLLVDTTPEGAIVLRPAAIYPIEIYSDARIREFDAADRMDAKTAARLARILKRK
jgi:AbrB family looped-hinge helix DNA binding protein